MTNTEVKNDNGLATDQSEVVKNMLEARVCYGHRSFKTNPRMKSFIVGTKNGVEIIDLEKTAEYLEKARVFVQGYLKEKKAVMFVGTNPASRDLIKDAGEKTKSFYVVNRWIGGFLTNFKTVSNRLKYLKDLKEKEKNGQLQKYTKKERLNFQKQIEKLSGMFVGVEECLAIPQALVVVDSRMHETAILEAKKLHIPVVAIIDTDSDPTSVDYPIPGSDHIRSSIAYILNQLIAE